MVEPTGLVTYQEPLSMIVANFIISKGFSPADSRGKEKEMGSLDNSCFLGVLGPLPEPKTRLFGIIKKKTLRIFLGMITFKNSSDWTFNVYGRDNLDSVKKLAEDLALKFNAKITINLTMERSLQESLISEVDFLSSF